MDTTRELIHQSPGRRHDLDALRAFAMFLGVLLHAALSFTGNPWVIRDSRSAPLLGVLTTGIHGFRMELFFLVSGFFTAMLCRRRGITGMLKNRALRILIPCLLGLATIQPLTGWVIGKFNTPAGPRPDSDLVQAVRAGDTEEVANLLQAGGDPSEAEENHGMRLITIAAYAGHTDIVRLLLDRGVDPDSVNRSGSRPLHAAALVGKPAVAELLLDRGADPLVKNGSGATPLELTRADEEFTRGLTESIGIPAGPWPEVEQGRARLRELLAKQTGIDPEATKSPVSKPPKSVTWLDRYQEFLAADFWKVPWGDGHVHLVYTGVFGHLWFLWDLCWLLALYAMAARTGLFPCLTTDARLGLGAGTLLALLLSLVSNIPMHIGGPGFGPDTTTGWIPAPHLLAHYAVYFFFGAFYYSHAAHADRLGRWWPLWMGIALLALLPAGLVTMGNRWIDVPLQTVFCWLMIAGLMGLFHRYLGSESAVVRYLSDSSYWCYLIHMVPVFALQGLVRDWPFPAALKFCLVAVAITALLLASYQLLVRHTPVGWLLNGPRKG